MADAPKLALDSHSRLELCLGWATQDLLSTENLAWFSPVVKLPQGILNSLLQPSLMPAYTLQAEAAPGAQLATRQTRSSAVSSAPALLSQPSTSQNDTSSPDALVDDAAAPVVTTSEPPPKRRKITRGATKQVKEVPNIERRITRSMRLHALMNLPLDVILEVFCHLSPKDILTIARTSKWLRGTVFAKRNASMWRESREQFGVPEPAEGFSEPRWAALLFDRECQVCWSSRHSPKLQWNLLKRVDLFCVIKAVEQAHGPNMRTLEPEARDYYVPWGRFDGLAGKTYWTEEVIAVRKEWNRLKEEAEDPAGKEAFHEWKKESRDRMRAHHKNISTYKRWELMNDDDLKRNPKVLEAALAQHDREVQRMETEKSNLMERGYAAVDIEFSGLVIDTPSFKAAVMQQKRTNYFDGGFSAALPTIRIILNRTRNARLAFERELVTWERWDIFTRLYDQYVSTLQPFEQQYCPPAVALRKLSDVDKLLEGATFGLVVEDMQHYIDNARSSMKQSLVKACRTADREHTPEPWGLAKNVFQKRQSKTKVKTQGAPSTRVQVGWDMIATLRSKGFSTIDLRDRPGVYVPCYRSFELNVQSSRDSEQLIAMAGLPKMATVDEVDAVDPRFACKNKASGLAIYTWRGALLHMLKKPSHKMRLATEQEANAAKANDMLARAEVKAWSCNHCTQYLETSQTVTKQTVLDHLLDIHSVVNPEMPRDYFVNHGRRHTYEVTYFIPAKDQSISGNMLTADMEPVILNGRAMSGWGSVGGRVGVLGCVMSRSSRRDYT